MAYGKDLAPRLRKALDNHSHHTEEHVRTPMFSSFHEHVLWRRGLEPDGACGARFVRALPFIAPRPQDGLRRLPDERARLRLD